MPRSRHRHLLVLSLILLALLAAWLWQQRQMLLHEGLRLGGRFADVSVEDSAGVRIGLGGVAAERLTLLLPASGVQLELRGLQLDYHLRSLWQERRVQALRLQQLRVITVPSARSDTPPDAALALDRWLSLLRHPPLDHLAIADLDLPAFEDAELLLEVEDGAWRLGLDQGDLALQALVTAEGAGEDSGLALQLTVGAGVQRLAELQLQLSAEAGDRLLRGTGRLEVAALAERFAAELPARFRPEAGSLALTFQSSLAEMLSEPALDLRLEDDSWLRLPAGLLPSLDDVELRLRETALLPLRLRPRPALAQALLPLRLSGAWQGQPFDVQAELQPSCVLVELDCSVSQSLELRAEAAPAWLQPLRLNGSFQLRQRSLSFEQTLDWPGTAQPLALHLAGEHRLDARRGQALLQLPVLRFGPEQRLSGHLPAWPWPADLVGGELGADATLHWQLPEQGEAAWQAEAALQLRELAGVRDAWFFRGLSSELRASARSGAAFPLDLRPGTLSLAELDLGLPLRDLRLVFALDGQTGSLHFAELSVGLLGGRVYGENQDYVFGAASNALELAFEGLRVERMLELVDYQGVTATGELSGRIPLRLAPGQVEVEDGELRASPAGGTIHYQPAAGGGGGNPGIDLVEQALANYHYESLESQVDYLPNGDLELGMRLQGYNPDMNGGQRINLNLNLSNNIPQLLRSLQAGRRVEDFLRERVE